MRTGIKVEVSATDRVRPDAVVRYRNNQRKHVWRERFMTDGVAGLLHDKTWPPRIPPLEPDVATYVVATRDRPVALSRWPGSCLRPPGMRSTIKP